MYRREASNTRRKLMFGSAMAAVSIAACTKEKKVILVKLKISASGTYELAGKAVARGELEGALAANKPTEGIFGINLQQDPSAPQESVQYAIATASKVGATVGTVGNEIFWPPTTR